jgi:protoporphyrinogen oxidase
MSSNGHQSHDIEQKIVILGAGPTGLGAAYRLQELGYRNWAIYDRNPYLGGLATSYVDSLGFTYDIGGHVMFSHYKYFDDLVDKLLGSSYTEIMREAWVWMMDRYVPYPFQNNINYLPKEVVFDCLMGLIEAQKNPDGIKNAQNFDELIDAQFGRGIASVFMKPYNFKVWAHPVSHMNIEWLGERVAMPDLERVMKNVLFEQSDKAWGPNNKFKYPLYGGTGGLYTPFEPYIKDNLHLNRTAVAIDPEAREILFGDGEVVSYDLLLSTMPLDLLVHRLKDAPAQIRDATGGLHHSSGLIVGVGVNRKIDTEKCWIYFPEDNTPFYRMTYLHNYSPYITPDNDQYSLLLTETSYSPHKHETKHDIMDRVVAGLIDATMLTAEDLDRIATTYLIDVDYSYPVPTLDRNQALATIQPYLKRYNIYSRGRFGAWEYEIGNMDHSVMQGVELVNCWLLEEPETTWIDWSQPGKMKAVVTNGHFPVSVQGHGLIQTGEQPLTLRREDFGVLHDVENAHKIASLRDTGQPQ